MSFAVFVPSISHFPPSIRFIERCVLCDCVPPLSFNEPLSILRNQQTAWIGFRPPLSNQPDMKFTDQFVACLLMIANVMDLLHAKSDKVERVVFGRFERSKMKNGG